VQAIKYQLQERIPPPLTAEQIVVLHGVHRNVTDPGSCKVARRRIVRAHFLRCQTHHCSAAFVAATRHLAGPLESGLEDNAELARGLLDNFYGNANTEQDIWLIIDAERSRTPSADTFCRLLGGVFCRKRAPARAGRTCSAAGRDGSQIESRHCSFDRSPNEDMEFILASGEACKTLNWRGMSCSLTDVCDFTLVGSMSPGADSDPRVIRVGFEQPVQATRLNSDGSAKHRPKRACPPPVSWSCSQAF
jgi:hypothetical protein